MSTSPLHNQRLFFKHILPDVLKVNPNKLTISLGKKTEAEGNAAELEKIFPLTFGQPIATIERDIKKGTKTSYLPKKIGVILSGGPAPGGHNVIAGIFDAMMAANPTAKLIGFIGGPGGLVDNNTVAITSKLIDQFRNMGGFDIIGSGRTKIETPKQFEASLNTAKTLKLDAIVVIGGDDSNTNAVLLAEYFRKHGCQTQVIGVPKTIDGDLKNKYIETSFGFDTAAKTYSELIGNIARDSISSRKYWHFIRLMGRSASHITLECALQTQPNITLISEEIEEKKLSLKQIVKYIADSVEKRAKNDVHYGIVLIPEGIIEFIPECKTLIAQLNDILSKAPGTDLQAKKQFVLKSLSLSLHDTFKSFPPQIQAQLLLDRDAHGNVQVSLIETEKMLAEMVGEELRSRKSFKTAFSSQTHFFGYEGRCAFPSNFDAQYCYALGYNAFVLIANKLTGYLSSIQNLTAPISEWKPFGIPLTMMMNMEKRHGEDKPVIKKALVEQQGKAFKYFEKQREKWSIQTMFRYPGSIQYYGPDDIANATTLTLQKERPYKIPVKPTNDKTKEIKEIYL